VYFIKLFKFRCNDFEEHEVNLESMFMKYVIIVFLFAITSCSKEKDVSVILNQPFTLEPGAKACLNSQNVCLRFEKVNSDSRCPSTAICIWEGVAEVNLILNDGTNDYPFVLHTLDKLQYHKDTVINGYTIKLELLSPYPDSKPIDKKDYRAQLIISK
jgi:hypothetical protein